MTRRLDRSAPALVAALVAASTWFAATAAPISTVVAGGRTLVAVEPLLRQLEIGYVIEGTHLQVDGRDYPQPLVERDGVDMVDARAIARFLHLTIVQRDGTLVFSTASPSPGTSPTAPPSAELSALRRRLLEELNAHRADAGDATLVEDAVADEAAQYQSDDMARAGDMRHEDALGRSPLQRFDAFGGHAAWYAENVGWYGLDVIGAGDLWSVIDKLDGEMMAERPPDDGHRTNILSPRYQGVGIGVTVGPHGVYLAEDFVGR